jgi:cob(I)alamin adenosyltransferase
MLKSPSVTCLAGKRIPKSARILDILGDLDELNCFLGLVRAFSRKKKLDRELVYLQEDLVRIGGWLSGAKSKFPFQKKTTALENRIKDLEDRNLKKFSRPGANQVSVALHLARVAARRLERRVVRVRKNQSLVSYLNRLSTLIFWLAVEEER